MTLSDIPLHLPTLRGYDANTLLRLYDQAKQLRDTTRLQRERERAGVAIRRLAGELRGRGVRV